jgi:hypothetical protein
MDGKPRVKIEFGDHRHLDSEPCTPDCAGKGSVVTPVKRQAPVYFPPVVFFSGRRIGSLSHWDF